jgi:hypothetical protein
MSIGSGKVWRGFVLASDVHLVALVQLALLSFRYRYLVLIYLAWCICSFTFDVGRYSGGNTYFPGVGACLVTTVLCLRLDTGSG